jgi:hypothetical protein
MSREVQSEPLIVRRVEAIDALLEEVRSLLHQLAKALGVRVEDILGEQPVEQRRPGPVGKLQRVFEQAVSLPRRQQDLVARFVATLIEQQRKAS